MKFLKTYNRSPFRILTFVLIVAIAGMVLSSCSSSSTPAPTVTVTEQPYNDTPVYSPEDKFLNSLRGTGNTYLLGNPDSVLLDLGYQTCDLLDSGYTLTDIITYLAGSGDFQDIEQQQAIGYLIGAAVANFCSQYSYQVNDL